MRRSIAWRKRIPSFSPFYVGGGHEKGLGIRKAQIQFVCTYVWSLVIHDRDECVKGEENKP
jgi:hypothetical protein